jgi:hypothetical protein
MSPSMALSKARNQSTKKIHDVSGRQTKKITLYLKKVVLFFLIPDFAFASEGWAWALVWFWFAWVVLEVSLLFPFGLVVAVLLLLFPVFSVGFLLLLPRQPIICFKRQRTRGKCVVCCVCVCWRWWLSASRVGCVVLSFPIQVNLASVSCQSLLNNRERVFQILTVNLCSYCCRCFGFTHQSSL